MKEEERAPDHKLGLHGERVNDKSQKSSIFLKLFFLFFKSSKTFPFTSAHFPLDGFINLKTLYFYSLIAGVFLCGPELRLSNINCQKDQGF